MSSRRLLLLQFLDLRKENEWYGIEYDTTVSSPACTRIGNPYLHKSLPIQSRMKGCLLDDNGQVVEYLNPSDWTGQVRDGSRGQVMVEIPMHYRKFETNGTKRVVCLSEHPLPGYHQVPKMYVSAYEASIERSTGKLCSVVNDTTDYRGGDNNANYDGYKHVGNEVRTNDFVKEIIFGEEGEILPSVVGGNSTQFFCDYYYTIIPTTETLRGVLIGGTAYEGAFNGLVYATSADGPSHSNRNIGSRLCFIPSSL